MLTVKAVIDKITADNVEENNEMVILTTHLSQASNLVDHNLKKIKLHGVRENSCSLMESFLAGRKYFVEVQGAKSMLKSLLNCSVIQG